MIDLPLNHDEWDWYLDALSTSGIVDTRFTLYDQNEDPLGSLKHRVLDGSVNVDLSADVTRSLDLTLLDPHDQLRFEANSPSHAAIFADRYIGVHWGIYVAQMDDFVYCPVFRGPVTEFSRDGMEVSIECQGKETLMLEPHFATQGYTLKKRQRLDDAIEEVANKVGERRVHLPDLPHRLHKEHTVEPEAEPWLIIAGGKHVTGLTVVQKTHGKHDNGNGKGGGKHGQKLKTQNAPALIRLAPGNRRLYYDTRGRITQRHDNDEVQFVFRDGVKAQGHGRGPTILSRPRVTYDELEFINTVVVRGGTPKGKKQIVAVEHLHDAHPLSPSNLAKNGHPRYYTLFVDADNLKTWAECKDRARDELRKHKDSGVTVEFESLPIPFLEEGDMVRATAKSFHYDFPINQFTLPLGASDPMTVGYTTKTSKYARHYKRHHHKS